MPNSCLGLGFVLRRLLSMDFLRLHTLNLDTGPITTGDSMLALIVLYFIWLTERKCVYQRVIDADLRRLYTPVSL